MTYKQYIPQNNAYRLYNTGNLKEGNNEAVTGEPE
jgi:hypothetical protein